MADIGSETPPWHAPSLSDVFSSSSLAEGGNPTVRPLVDGTDDAELDGIVGEVAEIWKAMCDGRHPVETLREALNSKEAKLSFCRTMKHRMSDVYPEFHEKCTKFVNRNDAMQESIGHAGEAHLLMLGINQMSNGMSVFWKKLPAISRIEDCWRTALTSGTGLDTASSDDETKKQNRHLPSSSRDPLGRWLVRLTFVLIRVSGLVLELPVVCCAVFQAALRTSGIVPSVLIQRPFSP